MDSAGTLYIADLQNERIRTVSNGLIATIAGNGMAGGVSGDNGPAVMHINGPGRPAVATSQPVAFR